MAAARLLLHPGVEGPFAGRFPDRLLPGISIGCIENLDCTFLGQGD